MVNMKGYAPMSAKEVEAVISPNGYSGMFIDKEPEKSYDEKYPDDEVEMEDTKSNIKKPSRREYKFKKNEITVFNWGRKFNIK